MKAKQAENGAGAPAHDVPFFVRRDKVASEQLCRHARGSKIILRKESKPFWLRSETFEIF
jgi:hypothetical protein